MIRVILEFYSDEKDDIERWIQLNTHALENFTGIKSRVISISEEQNDGASDSPRDSAAS